MNSEDIKVTVCILSRNDNKFIEGCIAHIFNFVDEIIVIDASDDSKTIDIINNMKIGGKMGGGTNVFPKLVLVDDRGHIAEDFSVERNKIQAMAKYDWILHVDTDERFDRRFLVNMKKLIAKEIDTGKIPVIFRFPRVNHPNRENYPDYQARLVNKKYTIWKRRVHEIPILLTISEDLGLDISGVDNSIIIDFPIIHFKKDKTQIQQRWRDLRHVDVKDNYRKVMVISIFKNSIVWVKDILVCMYSSYRFNERLGEEKSRLEMYYSFIDGDSTDGTFEVLKDYVNEKSIPSIQLRRFEPKEEDFGIAKGDPCFRYRKLATIRNHVIEQSVGDGKLQFNDEDYILFMDSDVKFDEYVIHELIKDMEGCGADIIAPMIYIEDFKGYGNGYFYDSLAFRSLKGKQFNHLPPYSTDINMSGPSEVASVGSFYLMKYKVAKNVKYTGMHDSEQVEFCNSVRSNGFRIFISPRLSVLHVNFSKYRLEWH